ncbi:MAG: L-seryl-tRNA(Sec) selenium transferase [Nitrospiraceae bacterium]|nr:MAG: L-seryl-tRNA(Sec) selenium transferase [Nitrospiraceae bacterium]
MRGSYNNRMKLREQLSQLPQVNEYLTGPRGERWLKVYARSVVVRSIREVIEERRREILGGGAPDLSPDSLAGDIEQAIRRHGAYRLRKVVNASGVVIHTNLGRAVLSDRAIENVVAVAGSYSNLEYDIAGGRRGKRYSHIRDIIRELTGAEDGIVVNNNAAAVLLCLDTFARGREVVVSRGELVEIGGSFRIPAVMAASGAILREVGTTNKTHLPDYENALCGNTGLLMKVHQSNYTIRGFTEEVPVEGLVKLGRKYRIPVMDDLGSGCLISLEKYGITGEPTVQDVIRQGADLVTFSGDKLLGGPQAGIIAGREKLIARIQKNPMLRAMRCDKMTFAALEATLMQYRDGDRALRDIPALRMLTAPAETIRKRARKILSALKKSLSSQADLGIVPDQSRAGGGSLPETDFPTYAVSIKPGGMSVNALERKLRLGDPPVIARIQGDALLIDARSVLDREVRTLIECIFAAFT